MTDEEKEKSAVEIVQWFMRTVLSGSLFFLIFIIEFNVRKSLCFGLACSQFYHMLVSISSKLDNK